MTDNQKISEAWGLQDLPGVSQGNGILFRAAMGEDLDCPVSGFADYTKRARADLYDLSMPRLRNLARFWGADPKRTKTALIIEIVTTYAQRVHPTFRPRSNASIVIQDCPAKWCR